MSKHSMRKVSLLVGTLGGAMAGYLMSNKKLRDELAKAKDGEDVARMLGKHLQKDGKRLANHVREFVESDDVQNNITKVKQFASQKAQEARKELDKMVAQGAKSAKATAKKGVTKAKAGAKKATKKAVKNVKAKVKTVAKSAAKKRTSTKKKATPKKGKTVTKRVHAKSRKVSK